MQSKTINAIVSIMRMNGVCHDQRHWKELCDSLDAAAKRILNSNEILKERLRNVEGEYLKLKRENDRLRAALKPVLEFSLQNLQSNPMQTIREAQRIYKEGANNGKEQ